MKIEFIDILNSIKNSECGLVTFIKDYDKTNNIFIEAITLELKKSYNIEYDKIDSDYVKNITEKTIIFINMSNIPRIQGQLKGAMFRNLIGNENVILIALRRYNETTNTSLYGGEESYISNVIFLLKNKKLKVLKSRYTSPNENNIMDISNIIKLIRKLKLDIINKK